MEPTPWDASSLGDRFYYGPLINKPSFRRSLPSSVDSDHSVLATDGSASDWKRLETLFESSWFGPCGCIVNRSSSSRLDDLDSSLDDSDDSIPSVQPVSSSFWIAAAPFLRALCYPRTQPAALSLAPPSPLATHRLPSSSSSTSRNSPNVAPIPEPPFSCALAPTKKDAAPVPPPPLRPVPVPRRLPAPDASADGGALSPGIPIEPPPAAPVSPAGPFITTPFSPFDPTVPRLGTWANRQYRLLDVVSERGENGPGSVSGHSAASNQRSPDAGSIYLGHGCAGGSGSVSGSHSGSKPSRGFDSGDYSAACGTDSSGANRASLAGQSPAGSSPARPGSGDSTSCSDAAFGNGAVRNYDIPVPLSPLTQRKENIPLDPNQQPQQHHNGNHVNNPYVQGQPQGPQTAAAAQVEAPPRPVDSEALMAEAAWRWRFTRRWQAEQARTGTEEAGLGATDQVEEALAYLHATGATTSVSMQIAAPTERRTGRRGVHCSGTAATTGGANGSRGCGDVFSMEGSLPLTAGLSGTLGAGGGTLGYECGILGAFGSGSGSFTNGPRILGRQGSGELLAASREVASLNRRAAAVLQQQIDCELQAERRVQESLAQGPPWVGHLIQTVQIDEWGSFRFLMLKLRDQGRNGASCFGERQRILIRGRNYGTEGQLVEECHRELLMLSHKHNVPFESTTLMGGGVMEWRRDRDRHLHLHSGFVVDRALPLPPQQPMVLGGPVGGGGSGGGLLTGLAPGAVPPATAGRPASAIDLLHLAAALVRQSFPATYKITVLA